MAGINIFICERAMPWHTHAMNPIIEPDTQDRIVLTHEITNAAPDLEIVIP